MSSLVHPTIAQALAPFAPAPQQHRAQCGWRRVFLSAEDARQYEAGYARWPEPMPIEHAFSTPFSTGWFDAEHDEQDKHDQRIQDRLEELGLTDDEGAA